MLRSIARFASGRRTKWVVVGFWLLLAVVMQLPGKVTDVTDDRISSYLPDDAAAIVADKVIEDRFPGGQTTSSVAVYHRDGGLTDADKTGDRARGRRRWAGSTASLPPVAPFSAERARGPGVAGRRDRLHGHPDQREDAAADQRRSPKRCARSSTAAMG